MSFRRGAVGWSVILPFPGFEKLFNTVPCDTCLLILWQRQPKILLFCVCSGACFIFTNL